MTPREMYEQMAADVKALAAHVDLLDSDEEGRTFLWLLADTSHDAVEHLRSLVGVAA